MLPNPGDISPCGLVGNKRLCHSHSVFESTGYSISLIDSPITVSTQCFYPDSLDSESGERRVQAAPSGIKKKV